MAKKTPYVPPPSTQDEEMVVTVVRFRGSGESLRRGIDALTEAFSGAFGAPTPRQIGNGRKSALPHVSAPATIDHDAGDVDTPDNGDLPEDEQQQQQEPVGSVEPKSKKGSKPLYTFMNDLNLAPSGKTAWKSYAAAKGPEAFTDRLLVASAWLQTEGGLEHFAGRELFTCFRAMEWPTQADMTNGMRKLKSTKSYYDNPDHGKWRLTTHGLDAANAIVKG